MLVSTIRRSFIALLVIIVFHYSNALGQVYNHGVFWGRFVLSDQITPKLKWELYLQKRTQNAQPGEKNIFEAHHFTSIWLWANYNIDKNIKLSVSPLGYFNSKTFNRIESDTELPGVNEWRWSVRAETKQEFKFLNYFNRYSLEYRWRDFYHNNEYIPNWRIRYTARLEKPVKKLLSAEKPVVFFVADEVFIQFGKAVRNNPNTFDQNRINIGASYEVVKNIKLTVSYLNILQTRVSGKAIDNANVLWVIVNFDNLFSQFARKKSPVKD